MGLIHRRTPMLPIGPNGQTPDDITTSDRCARESLPPPFAVQLQVILVSMSHHLSVQKDCTWKGLATEHRILLQCKFGK